MIIKKTASFLAKAALFLIPILPLIVADPFFFPFITGKAFFFRILVEIAFAGWLILACLDAKYRPRWSPITIAVSAFALVTLVADLLGVNPIRSMWSNFERMEGWITIIHLWAMYMVATHVFGHDEEGRRAWHRFWNAELFVALIVAAYGIAQLAGWAAIHQGSTRIDASLGNAAYMAVYMLWNAGMATYMFFVARAKQISNHAFLTWFYPILAVLFAFEVFETATRGTILGLAGGIILACTLYAILAKKEKPVRRLGALGVVAIIIAIGAGLYASRNTHFVQSHETLNRLASISWSEAQGQARNYIWPMALKGAMQRPVLGWGQENFNYIFNAGYDARMWNQEQWFDRAHSVFIDWLVASGVLGLLAYLALYVYFLRAVWQSQLTLAEKTVLTAVLAGYAVHNLFVFDNLASYMMFFAALGFANSLKHGRPIKALGDKPMPSDAVEYIAAPAVLIALIAVIYFFNARPIQANQQLISALESCSYSRPDPALFERALSIGVYVSGQEIREQILSCATGAITSQQVAPASKEAIYELAVKSVQDQIAATKLRDARIYALGGSFYDSISQFDKGAALLETAHELSSAKQSIDVELANAYINMGQYAKAVALLGPAYEVTPQHPTLRTLYAMALIANGEESKAHQIFKDDPSVFEIRQTGQIYMLIKEYDKAIAVFKKLHDADPTGLTTGADLAQAQYAAGMKWSAVTTLRDLEKAHPEYKDQIEAAIKQAQG